MSLHAHGAKLNDALKRLLHDWDDVRRQWDDPASRRFYEEHVAPLEPTVRTALSAIDQMAAVLQQVERDCGDRV